MRTLNLGSVFPKLFISPFRHQLGCTVNKQEYLELVTVEFNANAEVVLESSFLRSKSFQLPLIAIIKLRM